MAFPGNPFMFTPLFAARVVFSEPETFARMIFFVSYISHIIQRTPPYFILLPRTPKPTPLLAAGVVFLEPETHGQARIFFFFLYLS